MKLYEFYFNPPAEKKEKLETDLIFQSFYFEPKNIYEKKMGSLYSLGVLKNPLPKNIYFLEKLTKFIKEKYYRKTILTPEKSFRLALKEANEFLEQMAKMGDISWLGNLSFAVLTIKDLKLNFTKVGEIKIILIRRGKIIDIERKLKLYDIEPYPLKIFGQVISGKLILDDLLLVFSKEVFDFFQKEDLLNLIAQSPQILEEKLKKILEEKKEKLKETRGLILAISLAKESSLKKSEIISPKISKEFSLKEIFFPLLKSLKEKIVLLFDKPQVRSWQEKITLAKKGGWLFFFIFILLIGYFLDKEEKKERINFYQSDLKEIEMKLMIVENLHLSPNPQDKERARWLLKESLEKISPILKNSWQLPKYFSARVFTLNEKILARLYALNNLEKIEDPEIYFQFEPEKFVPRRLIFFDGEIYFFSPYSNNIFKLDKNKNASILRIDKKFNLGLKVENSLLFFSKPNHLTILKNNQFATLSLEPPYSDFDFFEMAYFKENLYFFDKNTGQIIKYPLKKLDNGFFELKEPEFWLKKATVGESIGVDSNLWLLTKDSILKYRAGDLKEKISIDIFPPAKEFSKIFLSPALPYLYVLEPIQKRVLIFKKTGEILKQFQSEKFDNLLDLAVSDDGKTIFLLNGLTVFKILTNL